MKIFLFTFISIVYLAVGQNECLPTRCEPSGPVVRFPFRLKDHQPEHCGYPGFELSCTENGRIEFDLQFPVTASANNIILPLQMTVTIWDIDYKAQKMLASNAQALSCLPEKLTALNSSASPFEVEALGYSEGSTLFNCSNTKGYEKITCLSSRNYQVIAFASIYEITALPPYSSCFKMYNISYVPDNAFTRRDDEYGARFYLGWRRPSCGNCEAEGKYCRLRNSGAAEETECFSPEQPQHGTGTFCSTIPVCFKSCFPLQVKLSVFFVHSDLKISFDRNVWLTGITGGIVFLAFIMIASFFILKVMKRKKEDHKRIEKVLENHKDMRPRRYSYADIKRSTNSFKEKLGQGSYGTLHKGVLADGTLVAVKMLNGSEQNVEDFISEVERIGRMQHMNVLQLIGYCVGGHKRALIYEFLQSGTLEMCITSENQSHTLGWGKLHQIALGMAKGVDYVHQECTQKILNLDINPQSILLDHNVNPKVFVSTSTAARGAVEYFAPELFSSSFDIISQKADVYSFGMLCLDIIGRRKKFHGGAKESCEVYYPEWTHNQLANGEERAIQIEEEEENEIVKKLLIVGLWCIQWFPSDRPSIKAVIQMLEGDSMPAMPPNPFASFDLNTQKRTAF